MGTNIYMRKIPRRERQKELMELISKQCQQRIDSIRKDAGRCPGESDRSLDEDIDRCVNKYMKRCILENAHVDGSSCLLPILNSIKKERTLF